HPKDAQHQTAARTRLLCQRATQFGVRSEVALELLEYALLVFRQRHWGPPSPSAWSQCKSQGPLLTSRTHVRPLRDSLATSTTLRSMASHTTSGPPRRFTSEWAARVRHNGRKDSFLDEN